MPYAGLGQCRRKVCFVFRNSQSETVFRSVYHRTRGDSLHPAVKTKEKYLLLFIFEETYSLFRAASASNNFATTLIVHTTLGGILWLNDQPYNTFILPAGFETTILANERAQTHVLDRAATRISE